MTRIVLILLLIAVSSPAEEQLEQTDVWKPFQFFVGSWEGHETGKSGIGKGSRIYQFIMNGRYLYFENQSVFEPQEQNPKGEVHEDRTYFSYDRFRNQFVMREFHSEGFVNQYILEATSPDEKKFVFVSENIENAPAGLRARVMFEIANDREFTETFELAMPGKDFELFLKNFWKRKN